MVLSMHTMLNAVAPPTHLHKALCLVEGQELWDAHTHKGGLVWILELLIDLHVCKEYSTAAGASLVDVMPVLKPPRCNLRNQPPGPKQSNCVSSGQPCWSHMSGLTSLSSEMA
jgi:hypothetical protein